MVENRVQHTMHTSFCQHTHIYHVHCQASTMIPPKGTVVAPMPQTRLMATSLHHLQLELGTTGQLLAVSEHRPHGPRAYG